MNRARSGLDSDSVMSEYAQLQLLKPTRPETYVENVDTAGAPVTPLATAAIVLGSAADEFHAELSLELLYLLVFGLGTTR